MYIVNSTFFINFSIAKNAFTMQIELKYIFSENFINGVNVYHARQKVGLI